MRPIKRFEREHCDYHDISAKRRDDVLGILRRLERHAGIPIEQVTPDQIRDYLGELIATGFHPGTVGKHQRAIGTFFRWAFNVGLVDADFILRMKSIPAPRGATHHLPRPYSRQEMDEFWAKFDETHSHRSIPRLDHWLDRYARGLSPYQRPWYGLVAAQRNALIHLALFAGLRAAEMLYADVDDIHYDNEFVVVRHAARKNRAAVVRPREVPMTVDLSDALKRWIDLRARLPLDHDRPWLSLSPFGGAPLAPLTLRAHWDTPPVPGYYFHRLRHTCGTEWLRAGMPLEQVSKLLGHSNIQQTLGYAEIVQFDLSKTVARVSPAFGRAVGRRKRVA